MPSNNRPASSIAGNLRERLITGCIANDDPSGSPLNLPCGVHPLGVDVIMTPVPIILPGYNRPASVITNQLGTFLNIQSGTDGSSIGGSPQDVSRGVDPLGIDVDIKSPSANTSPRDNRPTSPIANKLITCQ
ncbi:MAG: hypothetical protein RBG13Loki_0294, partial [Promethearchaeota archaeon CR_4]